MSVLRVIVCGLITLIGTGMLLNAIAFSILMNKEYPSGNEWVGSYLLVLFVPSLILIVLIIKNRLDALLKITLIYILTAITFLGFAYIDRNMRHTLSEPFFDIIGFSINYSGSKWEKLKSIEIGYTSIILPVILFIYSLAIYIRSRKGHSNIFPVREIKDQT